MASSSSKKRSVEVQETSGTTKKSKVHPFFEINKHRKSLKSIWQPSIGSCKHAISGNVVNYPGVASFDLDGTVIVPKEGRKFPTSSTDWQWWRKSIPSMLKELHDQKYSIVFFTNQNLTSTRLKAWSEKIPLIAEAIPDIPFRLLAATGCDLYRKPLPGMWWELVKLFSYDNISIDKERSFFVGDAAGRLTDHSSVDRKFALNLSLKFYTPEEYFLKLSPAPYSLGGFDAKAFLKASVSDFVSEDFTGSEKPEVILLVGYPGLGKTTFYREHFPNYTHVNQDTLKRREKCLRVLEESLKSGKSCVVDNTNRDKATRKLYVDRARCLKVPIRCFVFKGGIDLAWHNIIYRTWCRSPELQHKESQRDPVPHHVLVSFQKQYEEPSMDEGFVDIQQIKWVFKGSDEDLQRWNMWLDL